MYAQQRLPLASTHGVAAWMLKEGGQLAGSPWCTRRTAATHARTHAERVQRPIRWALIVDWAGLVCLVTVPLMAFSAHHITVGCCVRGRVRIRS